MPLGNGIKANGNNKIIYKIS